MPKIDTSTIEGFDSMSAEEKISALLGVEIPESVDLSGYVKKSVFDAKASEAAELSKKLKGKMSEDELAEEERKKAQAEQDQKYADLENKYNDIVKKQKIAEYKARYLGLGYDEKLAQSTAEALQSGDMAKVFENGETFKAALEKKIKSDQMHQDPPPGGNGGKGVSAAEETAKKLGQARSEADKAAADTLKHYL